MATCSSCGAEIIWRRMHTGSRMPIDPEPHPEGNILLGSATGTSQVLSKEARKNHKAAGTPLYRSHFVTCTRPEQHRKKR